MRTRLSAVLTVFTALSIILPTALFGSNIGEPVWIGDAASSFNNPVEVEVVKSDQTETWLTFDIRGAELRSFSGFDGFEAEISGEGHTLKAGVPSLPKVSRLVAIPARAKVDFIVEYGDIQVIPGVKLLPTASVDYSEFKSGDNLVFEQNIYGKDAQFPNELVEIGTPAIMRDLRVARVTVNPLRWNPVTQELTLYKHIEVRIKYSAGGVENIKERDAVKVSRNFDKIYASKIVNYDELDLEVDEGYGTLLVISPTATGVAPIVQGLVDWKLKKGIPTVSVTTAQTGTSSSSIQNYIQNAYNTYNPKLEYVILIGDCAGTISIPASNGTGDHTYCRLEGNDILADIALGRFSCGNTTQLQVEVNKILMYESNPYMTVNSWYKKGSCAAGSGSGISPVFVNQTIKFRALQDGYTSVDTMWYYMGGSIPTFINNSINGGVGFFNYRGYYGMSNYTTSNIDQLTNYNKLPFAVSITCGTGDITSNGADIPEEFFRVGTPTAPTGAIAAIGTATTGTNTRCNNCVDTGIFGAIFEYDVFEFGNALNNGKYELYISFPDDPGLITNFSEWNNLIGDPSCQMWTDIPKAITPVYEDTISLGTSEYSVSIHETAGGLPVEDMFVSLYGTGVSMKGMTDENGEISFSLPQLSAGYFYVTATKHNYFPLAGRVVIQNTPINLDIFSVVVDDDNTGASVGNGNGQINPGETIELGITLKNYGTTTTGTGITANASISNAYITMMQGNLSFANIAAGSTAAGSNSLLFQVSSNMPYGQSIPVALNINSGQGQFAALSTQTLYAADLIYKSSAVQSTNNRLDPGETANIQITLNNAGNYGADGVQALLVSTNALLTVPGSGAAYGTVGVGANITQTFALTAANAVVPGSPFNLKMYLTGSNGYVDSTNFDLVVGLPVATDPMGPDGYGYYAIENTDANYSEKPVYNWIEIDATLGGAGTSLNLTDNGDEQDCSRQVDLPFDFTYYGQSYNTIGVCSNGWLAFGPGTSYFVDFRNWPIISTQGPPAMLAPFWDDLRTNTNPVRNVYKYYDSVNNRFIVEWNVRSAGSTNTSEKFQVILFDPDFYPTSTGDGEILFQYNDITQIAGIYDDNEYSTVGIRNQDYNDGLMVTYWNDYMAGSSNLVDGRAIKFTTDAPVFMYPPVITHVPLENVTSYEPGYYVYIDVDATAPINADSMLVYWRTASGQPFNVVEMTTDTTGAGFDYLGVIPAVIPGSVVNYYIFAADVNHASSTSPANAPNSGTYSFMVGPIELVVFEDAETENGWSLGVTGDNATAGIWVREDPVLSVADNTHVVQPEDDYTIAPGHICFVTGNAAAGASAGTNDVDGGKTTLLSPIYDLSEADNPIVSYSYWFSNNQGNNPSEDPWKVEVTNNGTSWVTVVNTTTSTPEMWLTNQFWLEDYVTPSDQVRIRFVATDENGPSLVEACVDDIYIRNLGTSWGSDIVVEMTPSTTPIVIPPAGGSFQYTITIQNTGTTPQTTDIWINLLLPNGSTYPVLSRLNITMPAGFTINRTLTQNIPGSAPSGNYLCRGFAGDYPAVVLAEDSFPFSKSGVDASGVQGWIISGWENEITGETLVPEVYSLKQNYPNPFNPETAMEFALPEAGKVVFKIYNIYGQEIAVLADGYMPAGYHTVVWNAEKMPSGVYFYSISAGEFRDVKKCVLIK